MAGPGKATLTAYVKETRTHTVTTVDSDGAAVNCSGMTLEVVIEQLDRTDVVTIVNASITKTSTTVSFAVANTCHTTEANYRWALRRTDTGVVIMHGPYVVRYAADN
jgi:gluconate kinase